jgi:hypothetical protein
MARLVPSEGLVAKRHHVSSILFGFVSQHVPTNHSLPTKSTSARLSNSTYSQSSSFTAAVLSVGFNVVDVVVSGLDEDKNNCVEEQGRTRVVVVVTHAAATGVGRCCCCGDCRVPAETSTRRMDRLIRELEPDGITHAADEEATRRIQRILTLSIIIVRNDRDEWNMRMALELSCVTIVSGGWGEARNDEPFERLSTKNVGTVSSFNCEIWEHQRMFSSQ